MKLLRAICQYSVLLICVAACGVMMLFLGIGAFVARVADLLKVGWDECRKLTVLLGLLLAGCAVQAERRPVAMTPPLPVIVSHMEGQAVAPPAPRPLTLYWSHPQQSGDQYQVWRSEDLQTWSLVDTTEAQSWPIPVPPDAAFFMVRATNIYSQQVSDWATSTGE